MDRPEATQCLDQGLRGAGLSSRLLMGRPESLFAVWSIHFKEFVDDFFSSSHLLFLPSLPSLHLSLPLFRRISGCKEEVSARHHAFSIQDSHREFHRSVLSQALGDTISVSKVQVQEPERMSF